MKHTERQETIRPRFASGTYESKVALARARQLLRRCGFSSNEYSIQKTKMTRKWTRPSETHAPPAARAGAVGGALTGALAGRSDSMESALSSVSWIAPNLRFFACVALGSFVGGLLGSLVEVFQFRKLASKIVSVADGEISILFISVNSPSRRRAGLDILAATGARSIRMVRAIPATNDPTKSLEKIPDVPKLPTQTKPTDRSR